MSLVVGPSPEVLLPALGQVGDPRRVTPISQNVLSSVPGSIGAGFRIGHVLEIGRQDRSLVAGRGFGADHLGYLD